MKITKKLPSDLHKTKSIGFSLPMDGSSVFNPIYDSKEQIKYNLINFLLTNHGERVFNPRFGANLRSLLFEEINLEDLDLLRKKIQDNIKLYFPYIKINKLEFIPNEDLNTLVFMFNYSIPDYNIEDSIEINIE